LFAAKAKERLQFCPSVFNHLPSCPWFFSKAKVSSIKEKLSNRSFCLMKNYQIIADYKSKTAMATSSVTCGSCIQKLKIYTNYSLDCD
jgi:hypothetical protein